MVSCAQPAELGPASFLSLQASGCLASQMPSVFSFRCPSFSSCDCFCSGFRTQPPPAPAMLLYASLMGGPISQLSSPFIHELFPLIDGLGQPGELTYLTVDSQDPLPQCHSLYFRADSVRKDLMRERLPALFCSSALGYRWGDGKPVCVIRTRMETCSLDSTSISSV